MGGSSKSVTVGYKYYVGMHMVLCHGQIDSLHKILVDDREAWAGAISQGQLEIDSPDLFGGESREGGISGKVDVLNGSPTQGINDYLQSKIGGLVSAFRGVASVVLRQNYVGLNPYLKKWSFWAKRIHKRRNGEPQWYDAKAEIPVYELDVSLNADDFFKYRVSDVGPGFDSIYAFQLVGNPVPYTTAEYDDSGWAEAKGAFSEGLYWGPFAVNTVVGSVCYRQIWLRKKIIVDNFNFITDLLLEAGHDDGVWVWWNGEEIPINHENPGGRTLSTFVISKNKIKTENTLVVQVINCYPGGSDTGIFAGVRAYPDPNRNVGAMNPAHIIRECLTDLDWGMGYQDADIDDVSFMAAADTLYNEKMGISILWDTQTTIEEFINLIVKHIDAVLYVDRTTGKFVLKLIRNDYEESSLITLNESNIEKITDFARPSFGELTNSVSVTYWDAMTGKDSTVTVQDIALAQMQQCTINVSVNYPGFVSSDIATRVAQRDLKSLSTPLAHCTIYANTDAASLNIGSCFKLSWNDYDIAELVMRVTGISYGDGKTNRVRIQCVQDVFSTPESVIVQQPPPAWENPSVPPVPAQIRKVFEIPYLELVQTVGQSDIDSILSANPEVGYVGAAAVRPGNAISARMFDDLGSGYTEIGNLDFSPGATLDGDIGEMATTFAIKDGVDLYQVQLDTWVEIDSEIMAVTAISETSITVKRGCLDTVPKKHLSGASLVFWDNYAQGDDTELVISDIAKVKICTVTGSGQLPLSAAPEDSVTISGRAARPYPPGNVKVNGAYFPQTIPGTDQLALTWAHRDRKQQTASLVGFTEGSIGPETGTVYTLRLYGETGSLLRTETGLTGTGYVWSSEVADSLLTVPGSAEYSYSEDKFDSDSTSLYTQYADSPGTWAISTGELVAAGGGQSVFIRNGTSYYDVAIEVDCNYSNEGGIVLRFQDNNNYYLCVINDDSAVFPYQNVAIFKRVNGTFSQLSSNIDISWPRGTSKTIKFEAVGNVFRVFINGVLVSSALDSSIATAGGVGMRKQGGDQSKYQAFRWDIKGEARLNGTVRFELESVRDTITSHQKHNISVDRVGFGYNFGKYFGGI